ncbi:MAG: YXWGXW repeat-containing protein [Calditrichae bacterium]|nr:YXWGXW repeat-containing protein [Calditrichia bacterium]
MRSIKNIIAALLFSIIIANVANAQIVVKVKPQKPDIVNLRPVQIDKGMIWIDGNWVVKNNRYVWANGYWVKANPALIRVNGYWKHVHGGWIWVEGHWKKQHAPYSKHRINKMH